MRLKILKENKELLEFGSSLRNQRYENDRLKAEIVRLAERGGMEVIDPKNITVCHIEDSVDATIGKYVNNGIDNVLFVNTGTVDANTLHRLFHFFREHSSGGLFKFLKALKELLTIPVYWVDSNKDIHKLSFMKAIGKMMK